MFIYRFLETFMDCQNTLLMKNMKYACLLGMAYDTKQKVLDQKVLSKDSPWSIVSMATKSLL